MQAAKTQVIVAAARRVELRDVAGTDDRVLERDGLRKAQGDAVTRRAEAARARVRGLQNRQVDHAEHGASVLHVLQGDHRAEERDAAHEGTRAVNRVHGPAIARACAR